MSTNRTTILFVDDDVGFLEVVQNLMLKLSEDTWEVLVAPDAAHGLGLIHERKIDLLARNCIWKSPPAGKAGTAFTRR